MTAATRFRSCARRLAPALAALALTVTAAAAWARPLLTDAPIVWYAGDDAPIPLPAEYDPPLMITEMDATFSQPIARALNPVRWFAGGGPAANTNALGEVPDSAWFTNRMGLRRLDRAELITGSGDADGPDRSEPWLIVGAKTDGVSQGFRIRDGAGQVWLLKFDPPAHPGQSIRAGVVSNLIFHACGYNVPVDRLVVFDRDDLAVGEGASLRGVRSQKDVQLTEANLDSVLAATRSVFADGYHCLGSKYLSGKPLGPITHTGVRQDDPNDTVAHEDRREWRALRVFCAWLNHNDMKIQNSLDMYVGEPDSGYVKHHLIDFASTLGTSGAQLFAKFGYEHGLDFNHTLRRLFTFGLTHDDWQEIAWPDHLDEVGYFSAERFDPLKWRPISPNADMANLDDRDGYWAAKIISAFTDADLRALVEQGFYQDPRSVDYLVETLGRRRDIIARTWFDRIAPLDFFQPDGDRLVGRDLGVERGIYPGAGSTYRWRQRPVRSDRGSGEPWSAYHDATAPALDLAAIVRPAAGAAEAFVAVEWQVRRDDQWQDPITVYLNPGDLRLIAVDR